MYIQALLFDKLHFSCVFGTIHFYLLFFSHVSIALSNRVLALICTNKLLLDIEGSFIVFFLFIFNALVSGLCPRPLEARLFWHFMNA